MERKPNLVVSRRAALASCALGVAKIVIPRIAFAEEADMSDSEDVVTVFEGAIVLDGRGDPDTRASVTGNAGTARLDFVYSNLSFHWSITLNAAAPSMSVSGDITLYELNDYGVESGVTDSTYFSMAYGTRSKSGTFKPTGLVPLVSYNCIMEGIAYDRLGSPIGVVVPGLVEHVYFSSYPS